VTTLLALSYFFSSISVYVRDVQQVIPVVSLVLLFTSTVFFSIRTAPDSLRAILYINPISIIADALRESIYTESVSWHRLLSLFFISSVMLVFFYKIYNKLKLGFTDVL
ncbi:ABC transporter permease, partial [Aeromonas salmonicida subsp. salmonicida]|nr:ABC transporter permease [Aeromonas salmonicida subsp. salmonicida]